MKKIKPDEMARIYWNRLRHRSVHEIHALLREFKDAPNAQSYWIVVKAFLQDFGAKSKRKN